MTKKEADIIVSACKRYELFATIINVLDNYSIKIENRIEFNSFEAAKLIVNALVIEKRTNKQQEKKDDVSSSETSFLKNRHHFHKQHNKGKANWGENRLNSDVQD